MCLILFMFCLFNVYCFQHRLLALLLVHFPPWGEVSVLYQVEGRADVRIASTDHVVHIQVLRPIIATIVSIATEVRNTETGRGSED